LPKKVTEAGLDGFQTRNSLVCDVTASFFRTLGFGVQYMGMSEDTKKCGLCGSGGITDFGHGNFEATIVCNACGAHWWKHWYTLTEWEAFVNEESLLDLDEGAKP
jgi:NADH pyrophosphatase NudC (nudix superfamily)